MSYIVLARKYRPQSFDDLVGQLPVSQTLRNALESNRIAHAYIFSGPRGVGKTTTARVLAKCLNCQKGPSIKPCDKCDSCLSISQGTSMDDVLEIDGASNRGIEQIRELRENAKYSPSKSRYRIYIIDEAHQITKDAFGALLKTLEEPPSHVVFMMATTEVHKIPAPILSRCQRFSLRPISPDLVFKHLKEICKKEKIKVEDDALKNIVRFVEGSLRDALSLLDQAVVYSPDGITTESLRELLGLLPTQLVQKFASVLKEGKPESILQNISDSVQNGIDITQLSKDLQNHYHLLLLSKAGVNDPLMSQDGNLQKEAKDYSFHILERNIRLLARAQEEMRRSDSPRAIFEIASLKIGQKTLDAHTLVQRLESLEKSGPAPSAPPPTPSRFTARPQPTPSSFTTKPKNFEQKPSSVKQPKAQAASTAVLEKTPPPTSQIDPQLKGAIEAGWGNFIDAVASEKQSLSAAIEEATVSFKESSLVLTFDKSFRQQIVDRSKELLKKAFLNSFNVLIPFETRLDTTNVSKKNQAKPTATRLSAPAPSNEPINSSTAVQFEDIAPDKAGDEAQKALKHFPGILKKEVPPS